MDVTRSPGHLCRNFCIDCPQCGMTLHFTEHTRASPTLLSIVFTLRAVFTIHRDSSFTTGRSGSAPPSFLSDPAPHFPGNKTDGKICVCYRLGTESDTGHTLPVLCLHRVLHVTVLHYGHCIMYSSYDICHNVYDSRLNQF